MAPTRRKKQRGGAPNLFEAQARIREWRLAEDPKKELNLDGLYLTEIPESVPSTVQNLTLRRNNFSVLPNMHEKYPTLRILVLSENELRYLPYLPENLEALVCDNNKLSSLPNLPASLIELNCAKNQISNIPKLPESLVFFNCEHNVVANLPELPIGIMQVFCSWNYLSQLPKFPDSLEVFSCWEGNRYMNQFFKQTVTGPKKETTAQYISRIRKYQHAEEILKQWISTGNTSAPLDFSGLGLEFLPRTPPQVKIINVSDNKLAYLPFNETIKKIIANNNEINRIIELPATLIHLEVQNNKLQTLPDLSSRLQYLDITGNQIATLPTLSDSLNTLITIGNPLPPEEAQRNDETTGEYISRIRNSQVEAFYAQTNFSQIRNIPRNTENSMYYEPVVNGQKMVNLRATNTQWNSEVEHPRYTSLLGYHKWVAQKGENPYTRRGLFQDDVRFYTARVPRQKGGFYDEALLRIVNWENYGNQSAALNLNGMKLTKLPRIPANVRFLNIADNMLTELPDWKKTHPMLQGLNFTDNQVSELKSLPDSVFLLGCEGNNLRKLPALPPKLGRLMCGFNKLVELPMKLPSTLTHLDCQSNMLQKLPTLPAGLLYLNCSGNPLPDQILQGAPMQHNGGISQQMANYVSKVQNYQHEKRSLLTKIKNRLTPPPSPSRRTLKRSRINK